MGFWKRVFGTEGTYNPECDPDYEEITKEDGMTKDALVEQEKEFINPISQVFFRAGLIACREYMARFVEAQNPVIAESIRANWWPSLGKDLGPPRQLEWGELTEGEYGTPTFRTKGPDEITATLEALPVALGFLGGDNPNTINPL